MEIILGIIAVIFIALTVALLALFYYMRKGVQFIRRIFNGEMTDEDVERLSKKFSSRKDKSNENFSSDYFKGSTQRSNQRQARNASSRTIRTEEGITIVDNRPLDHSNKKIFAQDEGEYVDFSES